MSLTAPPRRKVQPHHRKRTAEHHRKSKHYLQTYFPYLPMLLVVGLGLVVNSLWSAHGVLGANSDFSNTALLSATNAARLADHETPLLLNSQLTAAAEAKAQDMAQGNYWSHNTPEGRTPWSFVTAAGYAYERVGENLAYGFANANDTVTGWMNSTEHRANILNASYQDVGFGLANASNYQGKGPEVIIVAFYAQPAPAVANITFTVPAASGAVGSVKAAETAEPASQMVSRVQLLTGGQAPWSLFVASVLMTTALLVFVLRHGILLRRLVSRGELFMVHHPAIDILIAAIATIGFVLTRASGLIR